MTHRWALRCPPPADLVPPVPVDPSGRDGPTKGQARGPRWRRSSPGLYVPSKTAQTLEQRILEEAQRLPAGGAVSGWAALRLFGGNMFDGLDTDGRTELPIPLVAPRHRDFRPGRRSRRHRESLEPDEVTQRHGIATTTAERALFDGMHWAVDLREAVAVADMAFAAQLTTPAAILDWLDERPGRRGITRVRRALAYAVTRSRTPAETRLRLIWEIDAGLPRPLCNWPVADEHGVRIGRPDLLSQELGVVGEFDGRDHREISTQAEDVDKEGRYRDAGLECFRVVGRDLFDRPLVVQRIRSAARRAAEADRPRRWLISSAPGPL